MPKPVPAVEVPTMMAAGDAMVSGEVFIDVDPDEDVSQTARPTRPPEGVTVLPAGHVVGSYEIEGLLGVGGGGVVYSVRHRVLGRRAALKAIREDIASSPSMVARFVREAAAVNKVHHPNIVDIYDFGELAPDRPYFVMEFLDGIDLRKLLRERGRFSPQEVLEIFEPVCGAVQAAHDAGIVHRDIKASNIVIVEKNGEQVVKLVDFGIAKPIYESSGQGLTGPGLLVGSAHNMAPEQIRGEAVDARTDVYALGTLAFHLLTGRHAFHGSDSSEITRLHLQTPPPRPGAIAPVPPALDGVVLRCLEKVPARRFPSAVSLLAAFRTALGRPDGLANRPVWAVGVHFELTTGDIDDMEDALVEDIGNVLDTIDQGLSASEFSCPFRTSTAMLGVRVASSRAEAEREGRHVLSILAQWQAILANRAGRHPDLRVWASLAVGQALGREGVGGLEITGGPLLDFNTWVDPKRVRMS